VKYLIRLTNGDPQKAEDIAQETLLRAWKHPEHRSVDGRWSRPGCSPSRRRIAIDQIRAVKARPAEASGRPDGRVFCAWGRFEQLLEAAKRSGTRWRRLPERLRSTLVAIYFQECSVAEAAESGNTAGTVKSVRSTPCAPCGTSLPNAVSQFTSSSGRGL